MRSNLVVASSWNHEDRTVDKSPTQLSETFLPLLLTLLFGGADLGAGVSGGRRRGVSGWFQVIYRLWLRKGVALT
jgi:hypothetical protein